MLHSLPRCWLTWTSLLTFWFAIVQRSALLRLISCSVGSCGATCLFCCPPDTETKTKEKNVKCVHISTVSSSRSKIQTSCFSIFSPWAIWSAWGGWYGGAFRWRVCPPLFKGIPGFWCCPSDSMWVIAFCGCCAPDSMGPTWYCRFCWNPDADTKKKIWNACTFQQYQVQDWIFKYLYSQFAHPGPSDAVPHIGSFAQFLKAPSMTYQLELESHLNHKYKKT